MANPYQVEPFLMQWPDQSHRLTRICSKIFSTHFATYIKRFNIAEKEKAMAYARD
jgi:hypothetical protein